MQITVTGFKKNQRIYNIKLIETKVKTFYLLTNLIQKASGSGNVEEQACKHLMQG